MNFIRILILCGFASCLAGWFLTQQISLYEDLQIRKLPCEIERLARLELEKMEEENPSNKTSFLRLCAYPQRYHGKRVKTSAYVYIAPTYEKYLYITSRGMEKDFVQFQISADFPFQKQFVELEGEFLLDGLHKKLKVHTARCLFDEKIPMTRIPSRLKKRVVKNGTSMTISYYEEDFNPKGEEK